MANSMLSFVMICGRFSFSRGQINEWYFVNGLLFIKNVAGPFAFGFVFNWSWHRKRISHPFTLLKLKAFSLNVCAMDVMHCGGRRNVDRSVFNWNKKKIYKFWLKWVLLCVLLKMQDSIYLHEKMQFTRKHLLPLNIQFVPKCMRMIF